MISTAAPRILRFSLILGFSLLAVLPTSAAGRGGLPPSMLPGTQALQTVERAVMPEVNVAALLAEDARRESAGAPVPLRYGRSLPVAFNPENSGTWETLGDGSRLWRLRIASPGALSLSIGLSRFELPAGAALWIHDPEGAQVQGPYTAANRNAVGGLRTAMVLGDEAVVELQLPSDLQREPALEISSVNHGYRFFGEREAVAALKRGACNVNVVCPEGNRWRDQIRSVALITVTSDGNDYGCTAQLINNTAEDNTPYLLTVQHCPITPEVAPTLVAYWNYESPTCDDFHGGSLSQNQSGATFVASSDYTTGGTDFGLVELDEQPDPAFDVFFAGWDARMDPPQASVCIHHPNAEEKSISFDTDPATVTSLGGTISPGDGKFLRVAGWDLGTTEFGSSGSCLFDEQSGLCVGTLTGGGTVPCTNFSDWYGRLHRQFTGDGTPETRLSDWLDPLDSGALFLTGKNPAGHATTSTWLIPAAASAPGVDTSNWKTQLAVANTSTSSLNALVYFVATGATWPGSLLGGPYLIGPGQSLYLDDPLLSLNPTTGLIYVMVDGPGTAVTSRTYNLAAGGSTFGQGIPGIRLNEATTATELVLPMVHSSPGRFRTNVGFAQTSAGWFSAFVSIFSADGELLAENKFRIETAWLQINDIFAQLGIGDLTVEGGWIRVRLAKGSPAFWTTYASVIDAQTDDPTYVLPVVP